ncbi:MAG TPA: BON domain-containing protein [Bryobacteraceae bacterium]|nr:BON domain-containing protein [Bryobacteraceae bacterium]
MARALLAGILVVAGAAAAKDKNDKHMDPFVNGPANESKLIQEVRHKLVTLPYYGVFDDLGFTVDGGTVTLLGQVVMPVLKDDAASTVKHIEGVTNVVNNIEVLPLSPMDNQIRRAVYRAIYGDPVLSTRYAFQAIPPIHIIVKNGNVRLEGVVANEMDRNISGIRANAVPGVFHIENQLRVEGK